MPLPFPRRLLLAVPAMTLLAACTSGGEDPVAGPSPSDAAAQACRSLSSELPDRVNGEERGTLPGDPAHTAVWGDPDIVLRCGVPRPAVLTPGSETYAPTSDAVEVNGVAWLLERTEDAVRFTTTDRDPFVEMTVPDDYWPEVNPLLDIAAAIAEHIPLNALYAGPDAEAGPGGGEG